MPADALTARPALRVGVVGGGVSGLVAARELALAGAEVLVCEAAERLGGRVESAELAGRRVDIGAEAFATRGGHVAELLRELGIAERAATPAPLGSWLVSAVDGAAAPLPPAGTLGIPAAPLSSATRRVLGLRGALRAAVEPLLPARVGRGSTTIAELVRARSGAAVLDRLVRPVALGVYSAPPERLPLSVLPGLEAEVQRTGSLTRGARALRGRTSAAGGAVATLRGGMTELVTALERAVREAGAEIRTGVPVAALDRAESGIALLGDAGEVHARVDAVVLAVPESVARAILGSPAECATESTVEVLVLALDRTHPTVASLVRAPRGTGALVSAAATGTGPAAGPAGAEGNATSPQIVAKALTHISRKWPHATHQDTELVRLSYGRDGAAPATIELDDDAALALALRDAAAILGAPLPREAVQGLARRTWQMPARGERTPVTPPAGVLLAGDWRSGAGFAAVIPAAQRTARELLTAHGVCAHTASAAPESAATPLDPSSERHPA